MNIIYDFLAYGFQSIYGFTGDWGIAIILLTVTVKILMLPFSIKQKVAMENQREISKKIENIKNTLKNQKEKMEEEIKKLSQDGSKNMLGCVLSLVQLPILLSLYNVFNRVPMQTASIIIPWVESLKLTDPYFIVPAATVFVQLMPGFLVALGVLNKDSFPKASFSQVVLSCIMGVLIFAKMPAAMGVYWVVSGLFNFLEHILFVFCRTKLSFR